MSPLDYDNSSAAYTPLHHPKRTFRRRFLTISLITLLLFLVWFTAWKSDYTSVYSLSKPYRRNTFISALYSIDTELRYYRSLMVLMYSLQKFHPNLPKHVMYVRERPLPNITLCQLEVQGWTPLAQSWIAPPSEEVFSHFKDQFTKLSMWNMTQFDGVFYLDADTAIFHPIDDAFSMLEHWPLIGVADNWFGQDARHINGGVLVLRPNVTTFFKMLGSYARDVDKYYISFAEQGFINYFFRHQIVRLPETYNLNVALYDNDTVEWDRLIPDARIVHYTWVKPTTLDSEITDNPDYLKVREKLRPTMLPWLELEVEMINSQWWQKVKAEMTKKCGYSNESDIVTYIEERAGAYRQGIF